MFIQDAIDSFFKRLMRIRYSAYLIILVPVAIACIRVFEEDIIHGLDTNVPFFVFHTIMFYQLMMMLILAAMRIATGRKHGEIAGAATVGLILGLLPPIIDIFIPGQEGKAYHYINEFSWLFLSPRLMLGETITLYIVIAGFGIFTAWLTRSAKRTLLAIVCSYFTLQIFAWGWNALTLQIVDFTESYFIDIMNLIAILVIFAVYASLNYKTVLPSIRRVNHALPWGLAAMIAGRMAGGEWFFIAIVGLAAVLSFLLVIIVNDYFDREQDASAGGEARFVEKDDLIFSFYMQALMLAWFLNFYPKAFAAILLFFTITACYHIPELRFKRLFCLNYKIEGFAGAAFFLLGLYILGPFPEGLWAPVITLLVMGGFSAGSMFKDYKDIDQDRLDKVGTIYTLLSARGKSIESIHRFVAVLTLSLLVVPAIWFVYLEKPYWQAAILLVMAAFPATLLLSIRNRKLAVESTMWAITCYFCALLFLVPVLRG